MNWLARITWNDANGNARYEKHEFSGESHQVVLDAARAGKIPHDRPFTIEVEQVPSDVDANT